MNPFSIKVRDQREKLSLSQAQLGSLAGLSRRTIVAYENSEKDPRRANVAKLARALGVTERYLVDDACEDPSAGIEEEPFVRRAQEAYGTRGAEEMAEILRKNEELFAGGLLSETQKDMFYEAVTKAYFLNKRRAREKFTPKAGQRRGQADGGAMGQ